MSSSTTESSLVQEEQVTPRRTRNRASGMIAATSRGVAGVTRDSRHRAANSRVRSGAALAESSRSGAGQRHELVPLESAANSGPHLGRSADSIDERQRQAAFAAHHSQSWPADATTMSFCRSEGTVRTAHA